MSYSIDLKKRVLGFIEEGGSKVEASKRFSIGRRTIFKWINKKRERGTLANKKRISLPRKLQEESLKKYLRKHPDHYLREIAVVFKVTPEAVFYACRRWDLTYKKNLTLQRKRRESTTRVSRKNKMHC
ncbi:MAG: transposase [Chthoniobacterales bacterium]|nr:transposase [Chthoniobacterales bacterium]